MRIVLLGAPGAGKGTQCKNIVKKFGLQHLSSGDILRQNRSAGTELGKKAQSYMDAGDLVPDDIIIDMMSEAVHNAPSSGYILDGFPRTVNQAQELDKSLADEGAIDAVLNLEVDDSVIEARMTGRRSCPECGTVYHIENLKPKTEGICDNDGAELVQRPDDTPEVVAKRLETYHRQTAPLVDYYRESVRVFDIEADKALDEVKTCVIESLRSLAE